MNIDNIRDENNKRIEEIKNKLKLDFENSKFKNDLEIQMKIGELLQKDDALFFNISIEDAYQILSKIFIDDEKIKNTYIELTSPQEYKELMNKFKV